MSQAQVDRNGGFSTSELREVNAADRLSYTVPPFGDEIKAKLKENGTFEAAHRYRSKLILAGTPAVEALQKTVNKFLRTDGKGNPTMKTLTAEDRRAPKSDFGDRKCSEIDAIRWVADVIEVRGVKPKDAPSSAAWGLLSWARLSPNTKTDFWKGLYVKTIRNITGSEDEGRFHHDPDAKLPDYLRDADNASEDGDDSDES